MSLFSPPAPLPLPPLTPSPAPEDPGGGGGASAAALMDDRVLRGALVWKAATVEYLRLATTQSRRRSDVVGELGCGGLL